MQLVRFFGYDGVSGRQNMVLLWLKAYSDWGRCP